MKNYDEASVVRSLNKKQSCIVNQFTKTIEINKALDDLGKGSWGKIDFLVHYRGYVYIFVTTLSKPKSIINSEPEKITKTQKRENKINMVAMTKNAMKKSKK